MAEFYQIFQLFSYRFLEMNWNSPIFVLLVYNLAFSLFIRLGHGLCGSRCIISIIFYSVLQPSSNCPRLALISQKNFLFYHFNSYFAYIIQFDYRFFCFPNNFWGSVCGFFLIRCACIKFTGVSIVVGLSRLFVYYPEIFRVYLLRKSHLTWYWYGTACV